MSNASLKDQLQALAAQLSDTLVKTQEPKRSEKQAKLTQKPNEAHKRKLAKPAKKVQNEKSSTVSKPKPKWLVYVQYGVDLLRAYFPQVFTSGHEIKPLKKGIKQDLIKALSALNNIATDDKACMVKSLAYYVNTAAYHKKVVVNAVRIDLDGKPAGTVTAEEAKYSAERIHAKQQAKIAKASLAAKPLEKVEVVN